MLDDYDHDDEAPKHPKMKIFFFLIHFFRAHSNKKKNKQFNQPTDQEQTMDFLILSQFCFQQWLNSEQNREKKFSFFKVKKTPDTKCFK